LVKEFEPNTQNSQTIVVVSNIKSYDVKLVNEKGFNKYLNEFRFWGYRPIGSSGNSVNHLLIHLTDIKQEQNQFSSPKTGVYMSANVVMDNNGQLEVTAYLSEYILEQKDRSAFFDQLVIAALYRFTHEISSNTQMKDVDQNLQQVYATMAKEHVSFFDVQKK
jgi:hypothetical protein